MAEAFQSKHDVALNLAANHLNVPKDLKDRREKFRRLLQAAVQEAWRGHGKHGKLPYRSPTVKILERVREASPSKAMELLQREDRKYPEVEMAATLISCQSVKIPTAADITEEDWLGEWWTAATPAQHKEAIEGAIKSAGQLRVRGRSPGTPGRPAFDLFVSQLYHFAAAFGGLPGSVSQSGSDDPKGNMIRALYALEAVLPKGFIPVEPKSRLNAVKRAAKRWKEISQADP